MPSDLNPDLIMNIEELREYCLKKPGVSESMPFGDDTLVFKVADKMFALLNLDGEPGVNLKADPEDVISLCETYPSVTPGYHMSKKHWVTVNLDGSVKDGLICKWIDNSYFLVAQNLTKKQKENLK